jgi:putative ABC transport system substrate-binding protein
MTVDYRWADGQYDRLPILAAELVSLNPDIIITSGTPCTLALKQATSTVPIVVAAIGNAVEAGAVASLARPGGNITGSSFLWEELTTKRVEILKAAVPRLTRVGLLHNRTCPMRNAASMSLLHVPMTERRRACLPAGCLTGQPPEPGGRGLPPGLRADRR